jgi:hypothetical protein
LGELAAGTEAVQWQAVNVARRTLGRWLLATFLEKGCDPATARLPASIPRIRPLSARELAECNPLRGGLVPVTNVCSLALWASAHGRAL